MCVFKSNFQAKAFDQLDEELGVSALMAKEKKQKKPKKPKGPSDTAGMVIGHGREAFVEGDQILVLQDKGKNQKLWFSTRHFNFFRCAR